MIYDVQRFFAVVQSTSWKLLRLQFRLEFKRKTEKFREKWKAARSEIGDVDNINSLLSDVINKAARASVLGILIDSSLFSRHYDFVESKCHASLLLCCCLMIMTQLWSLHRRSCRCHFRKTIFRNFRLHISRSESIM